MPIVTVQMLTGRTTQQRKELAEVLLRETARICGCAPEAVKVCIQEIPAENWNIGGVWGPDVVAARQKAAAAAAKKAPAKKTAAKKAAAPKKAVAPKKPAAKKAAPKKAAPKKK